MWAAAPNYNKVHNGVVSSILSITEVTNILFFLKFKRMHQTVDYMCTILEYVQLFC